jgi:uroporphyrinogen-III decarboxylase
MGTLMMSPAMGMRFNLPNIARVVETVRKEFNQPTWLHIHGDMKTKKAYEYLTKLAKEAGVEGFHFDENNPPEWIKENVVDKLGVPACIITDGARIVSGPVEKIKAEVKDMISKVGEGLGIMMAPSCQVLPATPNDHFKAWVDATHEYGKYPLKK